MTRSIPTWLTPITQELELERPAVVTTDYIADLRHKFGVSPPPNRIIEHLSERGWLLKTGIRGAWEFIPAERASALSAGSPLLELKGALALAHDLPVALALGSALWMYDLADRPPEPHEIAIPSRMHLPIGLRRTYRIVRHSIHTDLRIVENLPVHSPASVLVHLASRPSDVRSWSSVIEALPELMSMADKTDILVELEGRSHATNVRFAYLYEHIAPELIHELRIEPAGKVWFGPRGRLRRHSSHWNLADTVLPVAPGTTRPTA